jgi:hypothetical protein
MEAMMGFHVGGAHLPPGFEYFWLGGLIVASIVGGVIWFFIRK